MAGVLLAAGRSQRFGSPKPLVEIEGEPVVRRLAGRLLAARLAPVVVVLGHRQTAVRQALAGLEVAVTVNRDYASGQASSVRAGLAAAGEVEAALFLPVDQPFVTTALVERLVAAWRQGRPAMVRPAFHGRPGAPNLIDRALFAELAELSGDAGGRQLVARHRDAVVTVELASGLPLADFDTAEELARLLRAARQAEEGAEGGG